MRAHLLTIAANRNTIEVKKSIDVGRLDIIWSSNLGDKGHLQTSALDYEVSCIAYTLIYNINLKSIWLIIEYNSKIDY